MSKNYYEVLGVPKTATEDELKKAYRTLSKKYHPDLQQGKSDAEKKAAEEKFKDINEAYSVLGDKDKRQKYDTFGTAEVNGGSGFGAGGFNPMEFFRRHFGSHFGDFDFGWDTDDSDAPRRTDYSAPKDGRNVEIGLEISFEEALYGSTREFDIKFRETCHHCKGSLSDNGQVSTCKACNGTGIRTIHHGMNFFQSTTCPECGGSGTIPEKMCHVCGGSGEEEISHHINIKIPRGVDTGERLRVPGEGEHGLNGGKNGDLYITVKVMEHPLFFRSRQNLSTLVYIPAIAVGVMDEIEVATPWGKKTIKIPDRLQNDGTFVVKMTGYGMKCTKRGMDLTGDLFVKIVPDPMINLTDKQKKLARKLLESITPNNKTDAALAVENNARRFLEETEERRK